MEPKYIELASIIKDDIDRNFNIGDKYYSQRELMKSYNLSFATVEKSLKLLVNEGVVSCSQGKGTFVAKKIKPGQKLRLRNICVVAYYPNVNFYRNLYLSEICSGIDSVIRDKSISVTFATYGNFGRSQSIGEYDGVILVSARYKHRDCVQAVVDTGVPVVLFGTPLEGIDIPFVDSDIRSSTRQIVDYLADKGHKRLGFVTDYDESIHDIIRKEELFLRSSELGMITRDEWVFRTNYDTLNDDCIEHLGKVFSSPAYERPTVLMFSSLFLVSDSIISQLRKIGLNVPQDVSIIGFDDPTIVENHDLGITIMQQQLLEIGRRGMLKLLQLMDKKKVILARESIMPKMIERNSVENLRSAEESF